MKDEVLERIFAHKEMQKIPLGAQSTAVKAISEVLEQIKEENPYATVSELFESADTVSSADVPELQFSTESNAEFVY